jgi:hypothetical protein
MTAGSRMADLRALLRAMAAQPTRAPGLREGPDTALLGRLTSLCDRLEGAGGPLTAAEAALALEVRRTALRALRDLSAVMAGLRDAQALLAGARDAPDLRTYGPGGQVRALAADHRLEQRR